MTPREEQTLRRITTALSSLRISAVLSEDAIHRRISEVFTKGGVSFEHEYKAFPRKRFDFWVDGIVVEVKKSRPDRKKLLIQLNKYTGDERVKAVVYVSGLGVQNRAPQHMPSLPSEMNGKPIVSVCLTMNWGVAV
jgi:CRISPR/Cas system-associated exonuclease Cas4 (RecB family)